MSAPTQLRQPAGVPVGGQFAVGARDESDVTLDADLADAPAEEPKGPPVYDFAAYKLDRAIEKIDAANRKLERNGIEDRFTYEVEEYVHTYTTRENGFEETITEKRCKLTLNEPELSFGGYHFVAALDHTGAGVIARTAPGQSLDGWRPDHQECDHCGTSRRRNATYVVADEDGNRKQIGSDCLEPFLGIKPKGLWALGYDLEDDLKEGDDDFFGAGTQGTTDIDTRELIATALAVSDGGKKYVSRARAEEWGKNATSSLVTGAVFGRPVNKKDAEERARIAELAKQYLEDGTADAVLAAGQNIAGDDDYPVNLRTALAGNYVDVKHAGIAVSAVAVWRREQDRDAAQSARAAIPKGFIAPVKGKIAGTTATVTKVAYLDNPYDYYGGVNTLVIFQTEDGHQVKWFASGRKEFEVGQTGSFTGGSVKAHEEYQGVDQTVVTRVKFEAAAPAKADDGETAAA